MWYGVPSMNTSESVHPYLTLKGTVIIAKDIQAARRRAVARDCRLLDDATPKQKEAFVHKYRRNNTGKQTIYDIARYLEGYESHSNGVGT